MCLDENQLCVMIESLGQAIKPLQSYRHFSTFFVIFNTFLFPIKYKYYPFKYLETIKMSSSIKVDKEIEDIRRTIGQMSKVLYKFYRNMENVTGRVDVPLNVFDSMLKGAKKDVAKVRDDFDQIIVQV